MATKAEKDDLRDKVILLVRDRFGGDYRRAFDHYDIAAKNEKISPNELTKLLEDAGIGNWLTRGVWAAGIIEQLDTDRDGSISLAEFQQVLKDDAGEAFREGGRDSSVSDEPAGALAPTGK